MLVKYLIRLYKKRFKCLIGRHEWVLSSVFGNSDMVRSTYFCKNCMMSHIVDDITITGTTTITAAMILSSDIKKPQPSWLNDLSKKVEKALEKNP